MPLSEQKGKSARLDAAVHGIVLEYLYSTKFEGLLLPASVKRVEEHDSDERLAIKDFACMDQAENFG